MFILTKEATIQKKTSPETGLARVNERREYFGHHRQTKVVGSDDLKRLIDARSNVWFFNDLYFKYTKRGNV